MNRNNNLINALVFQLIFSVSFSTALSANTIAQIATSDLLDNSELIFEGEVISTESMFVDNDYIVTIVEFYILDSIKGALKPGEVLSLQFTGGSVGQYGLDAGVRIPEPLEHGIYFVASANEVYLNPLMGWHQGHFLIGEAGQVTTINAQPVTEFNRQPPPTSLVVNSDAALGVSVANGDVDTTKPDQLVRKRRSRDSQSELSAKLFKEIIRMELADQQ